MNGSDTGRRRLAYHEAGHSVLACVLGHEFAEVSIKPDHDSYGRMTHTQRFLDKITSDEFTYSEESERVYRECIVVCLAGIAAEQVLLGVPVDLDDVTYENDRESAESFLMRFAAPGREQVIFNALMAKAEMLVTENADTIKTVAEALLHRKTLASHEVALMVKGGGLFDDLAVLRQIVLERAHTLAHIRLKHVPLEDVRAGEISLEDLVEAVYLDGVRDGMDYLKHLLEEGAKA